jgi:hypothetical protein
LAAGTPGDHIYAPFIFVLFVTKPTKPEPQMKRPLAHAVSLVVSAIAVALIAAQPERPEPSSGFLSPLHKGQAIALKDLGTAYEITVFANGPAPLGFEVVDFGRDFVVLRDVTGIREERIPAFAIKSITTLTIGVK